MMMADKWQRFVRPKILSKAELTASNWLCQKRGSCYQMVVVYFGDIFVGNREWLLDVVFF